MTRTTVFLATDVVWAWKRCRRPFSFQSHQVSESLGKGAVLGSVAPMSRSGSHLQLLLERIGARGAIVAQLLVLALCLCADATAVVSPNVVEFDLATSNYKTPISITSGPDGNLWFTVSGGPQSIGRITPLG